MGLIRGLLDWQFKTTADGRRAWYPPNWEGVGYIVSPQQEAHVRRVMSAYVLLRRIIGPVAIVLMWIIGPLLGFLVAAGVMIVYFGIEAIVKARLRRDLPVTHEPVKHRERWYALGAGMGIPTSLVLLAVGTALAILLVVLVMRKEEPVSAIGVVLVVAVVLVFTTPPVVCLWYAVAARRRQSAEQ